MNEIVIRVFEAFAGYGAQSLALKALSQLYPCFSFGVVGISEIEESAIIAYQSLHGPNIFNFGDISKIEWNKVPDFDLLTYSFPCQDVSNNGKKEGFKKDINTRSSLVWECEKAIKIKRPRFLLMENVKNITSEKFENELNAWKQTLTKYGYVSEGVVLDASNFGIPQHRERYFLISILPNDTTDSVQLKQQLNCMTNQLKQIRKRKKNIQDFLIQDVRAKYYLHTSKN